HSGQRPTHLAGWCPHTSHSKTGRGLFAAPRPAEREVTAAGYRPGPTESPDTTDRRGRRDRWTVGQVPTPPGAPPSGPCSIGSGLRGTGVTGVFIGSRTSEIVVPLLNCRVSVTELPGSSAWARSAICRCWPWLGASTTKPHAGISMLIELSVCAGAVGDGEGPPSRASTTRPAGLVAPTSRTGSFVSLKIRTSSGTDAPLG